MKRFLSLLLLLAMVLGLVPTAFAAEREDSPTPLTEEDYLTADLMWEGVNATEERMQSKKATPRQTTEAIVAEVTSSPYYAQDSLIRRGEQIFWETTDGIPCGYSPRLSETLRNATASEGYDPATAETVLTTSFAARSGFPGSKDVFLIQPYYGLDENFTTQYVTEAENIAKALGGTATIYRTTDATIDNIAHAIEQGAVVIFDSHGDTDYSSGEDHVSQANSSYICLQTNAGLTADDYEKVTGTYGEYYHAFYGGSYGSMKYYCVDGTAIANHMDGASPKGLLWMAICLSMATDGLHAPLLAKGVEVAYGYSQSVTFQYDYAWEEAFWSQMFLGKTVWEAIACMKDTVGQWDWCHSASYDTIAEARATYCAFPIVVSSEDPYPGHGKVDDLQTVRSSWTLQPPCTHGSTRLVSGTPATCTEEGSISYYLCTQCNAVFADRSLTEQILLSDTLLPATGHSYDGGQVTLPAGCLSQGVLTYTCQACGHSYTEVIDRLGHQYEENICTLCGLQKPVAEPFAPGQSGTYVIAAKVNGQYYALPNTYTNKNSKMIPITVDASQGYVEKSLSSQVALELTYDASTGKYTIFNGSYYLRYASSTNLGGTTDPYFWTLETGKKGTWRFVSETETRGLIYRASAYNYFGGYYIPNVTSTGTEYYDVEILPIGEALPPQIPVDESIVIQHSLNLASDISINYVVKASLLEGYESFQMRCGIPVYEGNVSRDTRWVSLDPVLKGEYYYFTLRGITAVQMTDQIQATLCMFREDGGEYCSNTDVYSVRDYACSQLEKANASQLLKKLCTELLRYGSQAQSYKGYRTDCLADAELQEAHLARLTDLDTVTFQDNNRVLEDLTDPTVTWAGKTLNLDSKVVVKFVADLSQYSGDPKDLSLRYSYTDCAGNPVEGVIPEAVLYHEAKGYYAFDLDTLLAAELRTVITAAVYAGETRVSPTTEFSADAYAVNKTGDLKTLCKALMAYSDTALAYFTQN